MYYTYKQSIYCLVCALTCVLTVFSTVGCTEGEVRLVGSRANEGRVEICRLEQWQTVCNIDFDETSASVVCRQLGFSRISKLTA